MSVGHLSHPQIDQFFLSCSGKIKLSSQYFFKIYNTKHKDNDQADNRNEVSPDMIIRLTADTNFPWEFYPTNLHESTLENQKLAEKLMYILFLRYHKMLRLKTIKELNFQHK